MKLYVGVSEKFGVVGRARHRSVIGDHSSAVRMQCVGNFLTIYKPRVSIVESIFYT